MMLKKLYRYYPLTECEQINISDIYDGYVYVFVRVGEWVYEGSYMEYVPGLYHVQCIDNVYQGYGIDIPYTLSSFPHVNTLRECVDRLIKEFEKFKFLFPEWAIFYCEDNKAVDQFLSDYL